MLLAWLRFGIAALAMPHWLRRPPDEPPMTARTRGLVFLESFLGNFLFSVCMLFGVSMTSAVSAGVIMASIPAVVAVASWLFLARAHRAARRAGDRLRGDRHRVARVRAIRTAARRRTTRSTPTPWLGNLLVFCAVLCEAAYAVIGKSLTGRLGPSASRR